MKEYTTEQLNKIKKIELMMLSEFDKICRDNNLSYFISGGSGIGIVRHGGYIPWDDDIDIGMPRKDYNQFLNIIKKHYHKKYNIVNNDNYPDFPLMNTRLSLKGTKFITEDVKSVKGNDDFGIFLDLFPYDNVSNNQKKLVRQASFSWFYGKLMILTQVKSPVLYQKGFLKQMILTACKVFYYIFKLFHFNTRFFYNKAFKWANKYNNIETNRLGYLFDPSRYTSIVYNNEIFPLKEMKFENIDVFVPNKLENYLKRRFGDYMKLPPKEDRHNHPPYILDFGEYEKI